MSHNPHTHTGNTRQPEPQLKSSSCSSAIPSHNLMDAILSHNSRNITCLTPIPSHNSKDTFWATTQGTPTSRPLKHHQGLVDHAPPNQEKHFYYTLSPGITHKAPSATGIQTAWRGDAYRKAPSASTHNEFAIIAWRN